jgi:hypothetical protein
MSSATLVLGHLDHIEGSACDVLSQKRTKLLGVGKERIRPSINRWLLYHCSCPYM